MCSDSSGEAAMSNKTQQGGNLEPLSEKQISNLTIGGLKPISGRISIVGYDPEWPELFKREADRVRSTLGGRVIRIEHVGSTSAPGLAAKPTIDIVLEVPDSADESSYLPALETAGYSLR